MREKFGKQSIIKDDWLPQLPTANNYYGRLVLLEKSTPEDEVQNKPTQVRGEIDKITSENTQHKEIADIFQNIDGQSSSPSLVIIDGQPGIGKTTLCRKIVNMWTKDELPTKQFSVVLYCSLRDNKILKFKEVTDIMKAVYECNDVKKVSEHFNDSKGNGLLLIFDGWDELSTSHRKDSLPARIIRREMLLNSTVIVTSRTYATESILEMVEEKHMHVEVVGFSNREINNIIEETFEMNNQDSAKKLIDALNIQTHTRSLCYVPLICRMVIFIYRTKKELPQRLTEMYEYFILEAIKRHMKNRTDSTAKLKRIKKMNELPSDIAGYLDKLSYFAYLSLKDNNPRMTFDKTELIGALPNDDQGYLGLMTTVDVYDEELYQFLHLTIQEFLAAWWISQANDKVEKAFEEQFENDHFRMCLRFTAGLTSLKNEYFKNNYFNRYFDLRCSRDIAECSELYYTDLPMRLLHLLYESDNKELCQQLASACSVNDKSFCVQRLTRASRVNDPYDELCFLYFLRYSGIVWNNIHLCLSDKIPLDATRPLIQCKKISVTSSSFTCDVNRTLRVMSPDYLKDVHLIRISKFDAWMKCLLQSPYQLRTIHLSGDYMSPDKDEEFNMCGIASATSLESLHLNMKIYSYDDESIQMTNNIIRGVAMSKTITSLVMEGRFDFREPADAINELFQKNTKLEKLWLHSIEVPCDLTVNITEINTPLKSLNVSRSSKLTQSIILKTKDLESIAICVSTWPRFTITIPFEDYHLNELHFRCDRPDDHSMLEAQKFLSKLEENVELALKVLIIETPKFDLLLIQTLVKLVRKSSRTLKTLKLICPDIFLPVCGSQYDFGLMECISNSNIEVLTLPASIGPPSIRPLISAPSIGPLISPSIEPLLIPSNRQSLLIPSNRPSLLIPSNRPLLSPESLNRFITMISRLSILELKLTIPFDLSDDASEVHECVLKHMVTEILLSCSTIRELVVEVIPGNHPLAYKHNESISHVLSKAILSHKQLEYMKIFFHGASCPIYVRDMFDEVSQKCIENDRTPPILLIGGLRGFLIK